MQFIFTKTFIKQLKAFQNQKQRVEAIAEAIDDFQNHFLSSKYYRKKLQGYKDIHELAVGGDIRMIIQIIIQDDICYFLAIGSHSSLGLAGKDKRKL